jgi:hypothetical protein
MSNPGARTLRRPQQRRSSEHGRPRPCPNISTTPGRRKGGLSGAEVAEVASSVGAGDAERPVSHRGTTGRDAQRSDRAGPAKYYPEPQTRSAGSVAPAGDSERIAMQSRRTGTCDPVLLSASHSAARAAAARRAFQVEATGRQHVPGSQTDMRTGVHCQGISSTPESRTRVATSIC